MEKRTLTPVVHRLELPEGDVLPLLLRRLRDRPGLLVLDSAGGSPRHWSLLGFDPFLSFDDPRVAPTSLDGLESLLSDVRLAPGSTAEEGLGPFAGGFLGALAYELGVRGEALDLPEPAWPQPRIVGGLYRDWIWWEPASEGPPRAWLIVSEDSAHGMSAAEDAARRAREILRLIEPAPRAEEWKSPWPLEGTSEAPGDRTVPRKTHCARVAAVRDSIGRGEVYQANISHRMISTAPSDPLELYLRLRETNPAPYMGFLRFRSGEDACALLSSSPELLLELEVDPLGQRIARTRPIKGTVARGATPEEDARLRDSLLTSEKDLAELAMIVDLERNDLGRIAEPGQVTVGPFPELETYAAVHHLVADVRARVASAATAMDVVAALFPGGSITGAPKLRSMEVIAELEEEGRGFFTGSMGFLDLRGHAALSILIRTMVHRVQEGEAAVSFHVGGGITWNSDPGHEDDETLWKAAGMLRALTSSGTSPVTSPVDSQAR
ncbi:Aminodeoxychorismate synthase component 1 [Planctomycetes bacterium Poly30]|uniref:Aminodeoxychorismate synthase component 1 n=1 Tax=Saltatorellus ferox TaxID=2528018 RepID=A0A518ERE4_9BACT|nr:Aminodeoxychorismate synthase component 1 [Planctomycetes bacterium Poly30]